MHHDIQPCLISGIVPCTTRGVTGQTYSQHHFLESTCLEGSASAITLYSLVMHQDALQTRMHVLHGRLGTDLLGSHSTRPHYRYNLLLLHQD